MTNNQSHDDYTGHDVTPFPQRVQSERLVIRPSARCDRPYLQKWWNDPDVTDPGGNPSGMQYDDADMEDWFTRYVDSRQEATHFVICLRQPPQRPIGELYIAADDRPIGTDLALIIGEKQLWGQGYGREALRAFVGALFEAECCSTIRMDIQIEDVRALTITTYVGFEVETVWANGKFQTMLLTLEAFEKAHGNSTPAGSSTSA